MQDAEGWGMALYGAAMGIGIPLLLVRMHRERRRATAMLAELLAHAGATNVQVSQRTFRTGPIPRAAYTVAFYFFLAFQDRTGVAREAFAFVRREGFLGWRGPFVAAVVNPDGTELELEIDR